MSKFKLFFMSLVVMVGIIGWLVFSGNYPVVIINRSFITAKNFNEDFSASLNYYEQNQKIYGGDSQLLQSEELRKEVKSEDLARLVINKISDVKQGENTEKAAKILYGFSYDIFKKKVLEPMAKREILESRFYLNNKNIDEYLEEIKSKTKIIILLPEFDWNGKEVIMKK